ncbi:MAG: TadG family pilus assembly protein [Desulfobaccales bacterium]
MPKRVKGFVADQSGAMSLMIAFILVVLLALAALAVDYGYMSMVQGELQKAADAGALAGASALGSANNPAWSSGTAQATSLVQQNNAAGQLLADCQVDYGYWSKVSHILQASTITPQQTDVPAIQVTIVKSSGKNGGPVQLLFAPIFGVNTFDLSARAVAMLKPAANWSILETGNGNVTLNSNINVNRDVGDNGSGWFTMNSNVTVQGKVYLNTKTGLTNNGGVAQGGIEQDAGSNGILAQAVQDAQTAYSQLTGLANNFGSYPNINSNTTIIGTNTVNVVDVTNLLLNSNKTLTLSGTSSMSFVVMVSGTFILNSNSNVILSGGLTPGNVTFVDTGTGGVIINSNCTMNGSILSPNSSVTLNSNAALNGALVSGKDIILNSNIVVTPPQTFLPSTGHGTALVN